MADFVLAANQSKFPVGTTVGVYSREAFPGGATAPIGAAVTTAVVAANGTTTFTGLAVDTAYFAAAEVSGSWRRTEFRTAGLGRFGDIPETLALGDGEVPAWDASSESWTSLSVVTKGGVDHGTAVSYRRPLSLMVAAVEAGASVLVKDLNGGNLRVYTVPTGHSTGTSVNPVTADGNGRLPGYVDAPDFDLTITPPGGVAYTQKIRTSPPGVFHVNSFGAVPYHFNLAAATTTYLDSSAAIQAADLAAKASRTTGATVEFDAGSYVIDAPLYRTDNVTWKGQGRLATYLVKRRAVDTPIIDHVGLGKAIGRHDLRGIGFRCQDRDSHAADFPLIHVNSYLTAWEDVYVEDVQSDGVWWVTGDRCWFRDVVLAAEDHDNAGYGMKFTGAFNHDLNVTVEGWRKAGVLIDLRTNPGLSQGRLRINCEGLDGTYPAVAVAMLSCSGIEMSGSYITGASVVLDRDCRDNRVHGNNFVGGSIFDGSGENVIGPNAGIDPRPQDGKRLSDFFPSSIVVDPDNSHRSVAWYTAVGGGSLTKNDSISASVRARHRKGRLPLAIGGASGKGVYRTAENLTAGETYKVRVWWWSGSSGGTTARGQIQLIDNTSAAVLADSGVITRGGSTAEWYDNLYETVFQVPAGTTAVRVQLTTPDAGTVYLSAIDFIRTTNTNGGMEGTFASGIAPDWTQTAGTGTPSESTDVFRSGSKAQRLTVTAGQTITIGQDVSTSGLTFGAADQSALYLLSAEVMIESENVVNAALGYGSTDLFTDGLFQRRVRARGIVSGVWEPLSLILRPGTLTRLLFGLQSDTGAGSAVFDHVQMIPLKDSFSRKVWQSDEIDLTVASRNYIMIPPRIASRIRRIACVTTVAPTAPGTAATINVGISGASTHYGSMTVAAGATTAVGTITEIPASLNPPTRTALRPTAPLIVTTGGAVGNAGRWIVLVEYE